MVALCQTFGIQMPIPRKPRLEILGPLHTTLPYMNQLENMAIFCVSGETIISVFYINIYYLFEDPDENNAVD